MSIEFILVEAAKTLVQAVRITFLLFWWLGSALSAYIDASKSTWKRTR